MKNYEKIIKYLEEKGVPKSILDLLDEKKIEDLWEAFEEDTEEETLEAIVDYLLFLDAVENPNKYKRVRTAVTFASPILNYLKRVNSLIGTEEGDVYPFAYFVEDIVSWVLLDPRRFKQFLDDTYFKVGEEGHEEEGEAGKK
ncbi:hypothetical protein DRN43_02300 [Thermococci archaeon]|nr:MAG: hypothetical protein DRJ03_12575 [Chloroflexota bacterium]RLF90148.1 MAG: hypothetical protein DRN43_02300 [Thermococci archaeon]